MMNQEEARWRGGWRGGRWGGGTVCAIPSQHHQRSDGRCAGRDTAPLPPVSKHVPPPPGLTSPNNTSTSTAAQTGTHPPTLSPSLCPSLSLPLPPPPLPLPLPLPLPPHPHSLLEGGQLPPCQAAAALVRQEPPQEAAHSGQSHVHAHHQIAHKQPAVDDGLVQPVRVFWGEVAVVGVGWLVAWLVGWLVAGIRGSIR